MLGTSKNRPQLSLRSSRRGVVLEENPQSQPAPKPTAGFSSLRNRIKRGKRGPQPSRSPRRSPQQAPNAMPMSPPAERRLQLLPRIVEYRAKGLISAADEATLIGQLERRSKVNPFDSSDVASVENSLNEIARGSLGGGNFDGRTSLQNDGDKEVILEPRHLSDVDEESLRNLFVETCFFARLGFLQPPTCLQCVFHESVENRPANANCVNHVVWRKDAKMLLHPDNLDGNLVLVQCRTARKLVQGHPIDSHQWDSVHLQLLSKR